MRIAAATRGGWLAPKGMQDARGRRAPTAVDVMMETSTLPAPVCTALVWILDGAAAEAAVVVAWAVRVRVAAAALLAPHAAMAMTVPMVVLATKGPRGDMARLALDGVTTVLTAAAELAQGRWVAGRLPAQAPMVAVIVCTTTSVGEAVWSLSLGVSMAIPKLMGEDNLLGCAFIPSVIRLSSLSWIGTGMETKMVLAVTVDLIIIVKLPDLTGVMILIGIGFRAGREGSTGVILNATTNHWEEINGLHFGTGTGVDMSSANHIGAAGTGCDLPSFAHCQEIAVRVLKDYTADMRLYLARCTDPTSMQSQILVRTCRTNGASAALITLLTMPEVSSAGDCEASSVLRMLAAAAELPLRRSPRAARRRGAGAPASESIRCMRGSARAHRDRLLPL